MSEHNPNALHDNSEMWFGQYDGKPLGEIPDSYWIWFLKQSWCDRQPALVEYANCVIESEDTEG